MVNELKRNASGYYDPTAYEAIRKVDEEMKLNPGEIWEVSMNNGRMCTCVILNANENIVSTVPLFETRRNDWEVEVKANGIMFANTAMVKYEYANCFVSFIRIMKEEEFEKVKESVKERLGLGDFDECEKCSWQQAEKERTDELEAEVHRLRTKTEEQAETIKVLTEGNTNAPKFDEDIKAKVNMFSDVVKIKTERDLYKSLYESTLERLIKAV